MAFKQYTHCMEFDAFKGHWQGSSQGPLVPLLLNAFARALVSAVLGAIGGALLGSIFGGAGIGAIAGGYIGFSYGFVDGFCDQWLNWRLICVSGEQCASGRVAWIETPGDKFYHDPIEWMFDNDLSFNLRLNPYSGKKFVDGHWQTQFNRDSAVETYGLDKISADAFPSTNLLRKPRKADGTEWDLSYKGYESDKKPDHPGGRWTLHCEIEGNGMETLCTIAKVLAVLAPVAFVAGPIAGAIVGAYYLGSKAYDAVHKACKKACKVPILCDIVCFFAAAAAAAVAAYVGFWLGGLLGAIPGLGALLVGGLISVAVRDNGSFEDVANDPDSGTIEDDDCVFVFGDHVYDAGHSEGWTEIHPVKHLQKVCSSEMFKSDSSTYEPDCCPSATTGSAFFNSVQFHDDVKKFWDRWCEAVRVGRKAETLAAQDLPQNWWCIHPLVDGCRPNYRGGDFR